MRRLLAYLAAICVASPLLAQAPPIRAGRLSPEEQAALVPGWSVAFTSLANGASDTRRARLPALFVAEGDAPTPFLPPGPFRAAFEGYLKMGLRGSAKLQLEGQGSAVVSINGAEVLKSTGESLEKLPAANVDLAKGYNRIRIEFSSPAKGASQLRFLWTGETFATETVPTDVLFCDSRAEPLRTGEALREGREIFASRHCAKCHQSDAMAKIDSKLGMPELAAPAPHLRRGGGYGVAWLEAWILNPKSMRHRATMPFALAHLPEGIRKQAAADLAAFLNAGKDAPIPAPPSPPADAAALGSRLFENLGCIACHRFTPPGEADDFGRTSLHFVKEKFAASGFLEAFLEDPTQRHPWTRMPKFRLEPAERAALAAFLRQESKGEIAPSGLKGDLLQGQHMFLGAGCANCHAAGDSQVNLPRQADIFQRPAAGGCLAEVAADRKQAPDFGWTPEERGALKKFLGSSMQSLAIDRPEEFAARQMRLLNCTACHRRDGSGGRLTDVLEAEGKQGLTAEFFPPLSRAGEKLQPEWTTKLLEGKVTKTRHWLKARMPAFPARAEKLAIGLSYEHGFDIAEEPFPAPDEQASSPVGKQLTQAQGGFDCVKCHAVGNTPAVAPFEAPGINLAYASERLRYGYYTHWMLDPQRIDPYTKMPKFSQDGLATGITSVYEGNAKKQFDALWKYLKTLEK